MVMMSVPLERLVGVAGETVGVGVEESLACGEEEGVVGADGLHCAPHRPRSNRRPAGLPRAAASCRRHGQAEGHYRVGLEGHAEEDRVATVDLFRRAGGNRPVNDHRLTRQHPQLKSDIII